MQFIWPTPRAVFYRLNRLRRLIAVCVVAPLVIFALTGALGFGWVGSVGGLTLAAILITVVIASHAVLFPNSSQETLVLSLLLSFLGLFGPFFGVFGWVFFLIIGFIFFMYGQNAILGRQMASAPRDATFQSKIKTNASLEEARAWFPLRPDSARAHDRSGPLSEQGLFPVWYEPPTLNFFDEYDIPMPGDIDQSAESGEITAPETATYFAQIEIDEKNQQRTGIFETNDIKSIPKVLIEHHFKPLKSGVEVIEVENALGTPWAQAAAIWLTDFAKDGLVFHRDILEGRETLALRTVHKESLLTLLGKRFMKRMMRDGPAGFANEDGAIGVVQESSQKDLNALLTRLGSDFTTKGHTPGPMPLVTLEAFFEGNKDDGSFQAATLGTAHTALHALRNKEEVADVRLGITQWEGPSTWPLAEYIYLVTTADVSTVKGWMKEAKLWVSEVSQGHDHRTREDLVVPDGHRVIWAWID